MNVQNIITFLTIIKAGTITQAAEELFVTQSAVSHRLKSLEGELGTSLIIRHQGQQSLSLTSKGEAFIPIAERWLSLYQDIQQLQKAENRIPLSIASVDSVNVYLFPEFYQALLYNPEVPLDLRIRTHQSIEIYNLINMQEVTVGFVLQPLLFNNIQIEKVLAEPMVLIRRYQDGESKTVRPQDLDPSKEIYIDWGSEFRLWHAQCFGPAVRPYLHLDTAGLILQMMDEADYWAIVPISVAQAFCRDNSFGVQPLLEPPPERTIYLLTHKHPMPSSMPAIEIVHKYIQEFAEYKGEIF